MSDEYHQGEITEAVIRRWAYDQDFWLCEQDEDLIFYQAKWLPLVIELAADPDCPKAADMLDWMDSFIRASGVQKSALIAQAQQQVSAYSSPRLNTWLVQLH